MENQKNSSNLLVRMLSLNALLMPNFSFDLVFLNLLEFNGLVIFDPIGPRLEPIPRKIFIL